MINHHDTEEAVQNAWIAIFKNMNKYEHSNKFEAWIKVIVIREAWKVRSLFGKEESISNFVNIFNIDMESQLLAKISCEEILEKLELLPLGPREVFKMYVLEGYKHAEIADIMHISVSTSRVHLTNARKAFRQMRIKAKKNTI